jgi:hypothetical protein
VALHVSHKVRATTVTVGLTHSELVAGLSIARCERHRLPAAGTGRIETSVFGRCLAGLVQRDMAGDCVSLPLRHVRHAIDLVCVCPVGRIDRPPHRVGEASCVAVLNAVKHDFIPLYELIDVHAQVRCRRMVDELPGQPCSQIARPATAGTARELHADAHADIP